MLWGDLNEMTDNQIQVDMQCSIKGDNCIISVRDLAR